MLGQYEVSRARQIKLAHAIMAGELTTPMLQAELEGINRRDGHKVKTTTSDTPKGQLSRILQFRFGIPSTLRAIEFVLELKESILAAVWFGLPKRAREKVLEQLPQIARACDKLVARLTRLKKPPKATREVSSDGLIQPQTGARAEPVPIRELLRGILFSGEDGETFCLEKEVLLSKYGATEDNALAALNALKQRWDDDKTKPIRELVAEISRVHGADSFDDLVKFMFQSASKSDIINLNELY